MAIYNKQGSLLARAYGIRGSDLNLAYDIEKEIVFHKIDPTDYNFKVMSFNVQSWTGLSAWQYVGSIFQNYDVDVVGLQETSSLSSLGTLGYNYSAFGSTRGANTVAAKIPLVNPTEKSYDQNHYEGKRTYQRMEVAFNGKTIAIYNTHLETSGMESIKVAQAKELFDAAVLDEYFIILGDFNTACKSTNDAEYTAIMKQFVDAGCNIANCSPQWGFNDTWTDGTDYSAVWYPCDHVITSQNISMANVVIDQTKVELGTGLAIDHLPVIAYLKIT